MVGSRDAVEGYQVPEQTALGLDESLKVLGPETCHQLTTSYREGKEVVLKHGLEFKRGINSVPFGASAVQRSHLRHGRAHIGRNLITGQPSGPTNVTWLIGSFDVVAYNLCWGSNGRHEG